MRTHVAIVLLAVALQGCKKEEHPAPAPPAPAPSATTPTPTPAPTPAEPAAAGGLKGQNKMMHCPAAVENVVVKIDDTADGVAIAITAKDPKDEKTVAEIRTRAKHMVSVGDVNPTEIRHDGSGQGGGGLGKCPVTTKDTKLSAEDVEGGSRIALIPTDPAQLGQLRQIVRERQQALENAGK